uniref:Competence protein ComEC n=1 Tax=Entamoeba invadens TaxID=33085 RepID=S0B2W3_ENTIV|nr:hypothetical protein [Entamoeba invadens]
MLALLVLSLLSVSDAAKGLDIHVFNVGQADSQLIVFPSGYSILVDAGEVKTGSMNCKIIAERIKAILGKSYVDVAVLTHLHMDHLGVPFKNGFWYLMETAGISFGKFVDRDSGAMKAGKTECSVEDDIDWHNAGTVSGPAIKWICYSTNTLLQTKVQPIRKIAVPCYKMITPPDEGADVEIVVSDARGVKYEGNPLTGDHRNETYAPSENDYSISLRIQYRNFVYSTSGDLDGENSKSEFKYMYHNIESVYKDVVGEVDAYHANHHGSSHSNNAEWLLALKPTVSVISCGAGNLYKHPTEVAVTNMSTYSKKIYLTQNCNPTVTDKFSKAIIVNDEILIHYPTGGVSFSISNQGGNFTTYFDVKKNKPTRKQCGIQN